MSHNHPKCNAPDCNGLADFYQDDKPVCAKHALTACDCGRLMPEIYAAYGMKCAECTIWAYENRSRANEA